MLLSSAHLVMIRMVHWVPEAPPPERTACLDTSPWAACEAGAPVIQHAAAEARAGRAGLNKNLRPMARSSTVINASFPLSIAHVEVPRFRAVNEEVRCSLPGLQVHSHLHSGF